MIYLYNRIQVTNKIECMAEKIQKLIWMSKTRWTKKCRNKSAYLSISLVWIFIAVKQICWWKSDHCFTMVGAQKGGNNVNVPYIGWHGDYRFVYISLNHEIVLWKC